MGGGIAIHEKLIYRGELPKKGRSWAALSFDGESGKKEGGGVSEGGSYPNAHYDRFLWKKEFSK